MHVIQCGTCIKFYGSLFDSSFYVMQRFLLRLTYGACLKVIPVGFFIGKGVAQVRLPSILAEFKPDLRIQKIKFPVNDERRVVFESIHFMPYMPVLQIGKKI